LVAFCREVVHVDWFAIGDRPSGRPASGDRQFDEINWHWPVMSPKNQRITLAQAYCRIVCVAQLRRGCDQRIEHLFQFEGRAADDLDHVGGRGLLLKRFAQLVEQPRVLDGDDGLLREIADKFNLLLRKWSYLLAVNADGTNQLVLLEHRNGHDRAGTHAGMTTFDVG